MASLQNAIAQASFHLAQKFRETNECNLMIGAVLPRTLETMTTSFTITVFLSVLCGNEFSYEK